MSAFEINPETEIREFFARPVLPPADIPALSITPKPFRSETIAAYLDEGPMHEIMAVLFEKVKAEDERVRRMLPPAPPGTEWRGEMQTEQPAYDFNRMHGDVSVRLRYRLVDLGPFPEAE